MEKEISTVTDLAVQLGIDPKRIRSWMRGQDWRLPVEKGSPWLLTLNQIAEIKTEFAHSESLQRSRENTVTANAGERPLYTLSVGDLLSTYSNVLSELKHRGLVRTHNAPIGDLAEYCAAVVYDGLLAPNSEKSYDLVAADGRKIQVKVRLIRPTTSPSAVFSPMRSFDFDVCAFILIDSVAGIVIAAREWSADEVRAHGRHREHTNGTVVRVGQVRASNAYGIDRTVDFDRAWREILSQGAEQASSTNSSTPSTPAYGHGRATSD